MDELWDSLAPIGNWLKGGTAPWWAALVTFYLGQRFSLRGAKEQRDADAVAREAERRHALTIVAAEHEAAAKRAKAEVDAAAKAAEAEAARSENAALRERAAQALDRAVESIGNLRGALSGLLPGHYVPEEVLREFFAATSAFGTVTIPTTNELHASVRDLGGRARGNNLREDKLRDVDDLLAKYQLDLSGRYHFLRTGDD